MEFVVNVNYRGKLKHPINLKTLNVPNSKLHLKPRQLVIKDENGTVILFAISSCQVMGCIHVLEASVLAVNYTLPMDKNNVPKIYF